MKTWFVLSATFLVFVAFPLNSISHQVEIDLRQDLADITISVPGLPGHKPFGRIVATGDINGDSLGDLILSEPKADTVNGQETGVVYVIYGTADFPENHHIDLSSEEADIEIIGTYHQCLGYELHSGDINDDGFDDILMSFNGGYKMIYGSNNFPSHHVIDFSVHLADLTILAQGGGPGNVRTIHCADINGDFIDDIAIGDPDRNTYCYYPWPEGIIYVVYGDDNFPPNHSIDLISSQADITIYGRCGGSVTPGNLGWDISSGDINSDGIHDLIMSAYTASYYDDATTTGEVYILHGNTEFPDYYEINLEEDNPEALFYGVYSDGVGMAIASGDTNGDDYDDIIMKQRGVSAPYVSNPGGIFLVNGENFSSEYILGLRQESADLTVYGENPDDSAGSALFSCDIHGDGIEDILLGARWANPFGGGNPGGTYIINGKEQRPEYQVIHLSQERADVTIGGEGGDFGLDLSCIDINNDSYDDVIVTSAMDTVYVIYGIGCWDDDSDGYEDMECGGEDCDDSDGSINPGMTEICDFIDNNCNEEIDEGYDQDGDGYKTCDGDCDDSNPNIYPGAPEICNGIDDDCDGYVPPNETDEDGDGYRICEFDCDDEDVTVYPGAPELCDGKDNNCDYQVPADEVDRDWDGYRVCDGDCDDYKSYTYPGATEVCDGFDNNCDDILPTDEYDIDEDDYMVCEGDCDDNDPVTYPGATEICDGKDNDCDSQVPSSENDADEDGYRICEGDCDDTDSSRHPGATEICDGKDTDCSGFPGLDEVDDDEDGYMICENDCDDGDAAIYPGAEEQCNGKDDDCDDIVPQEELDADEDGFMICEGDCDDNDPDSRPGAPEICDGSDNDCDGELPFVESDADEDGFMICEGDCNDIDATIYPGAPEICDGKDNNCDYLMLEEEVDRDRDGWMVCEGDCDDDDADTYPGALEICDGKDNNCNGSIPSEEKDIDEDGYMICEGDCNDSNPAINPGAPEICDGYDNNCDDLLLVTEVDDDLDGIMVCSGDCDDQDPTVYPGAPEICDRQDNDCDGLMGPSEVNMDGDPVWLCEGDCNDQDPEMYPGAAEICDGKDNDCTGLPGSDEVDADEDGYMICDDDCDDENPEVNPSVEESTELGNCSDELDNDCDGFEDLDDSDCEEFTLVLNVSYGGGKLNLAFTLGMLQEATWVNYMILTFPSMQVIPLWSIPLPAIEPPFDLPISFSFPSLGLVGIWTALYTGEGPQAFEFRWVDTG